MTGQPLHIGLVAGEASGDILGADLMRALREIYPDCKFSGIGGPRMLAEGFDSLYPLDRLSVMGLVEPLKRLPELLRIRRDLREHFIAAPVDLMVGIDSPDFNLNLELSLRARGIPTAHYVSPSVWAWRRRRVFKIQRAVDLMLTLFPFESCFYEEHQVPVAFVGHPLADAIPPEDGRDDARAALGIDAGARVLCLMPGSRGSEVAHLAPDFLDTAAALCRAHPDLQVLLPAANPERRRQLDHLLSQREDAFPLKLLDGDSRLAMAASDAVLLASGTATLEAMLLGKPMVVCYRFGWWSYQLFSRLVKTPWFAIPNLLAQKELVPERVQGDVTPRVLVPLLEERLYNASARESLLRDFRQLHQQLRRGAGQRAAAALQPLLERHK